MKKYLYEINTSSEDAPAKVLRAVGYHKRVLEVGCASGMQTRILKEDLGCAVTGIEIDPAAAADAAQYCERVIVGDLESFDLSSALGDERFDVITVADVLEHLRDPRSVLSTLSRFMNPNGYVVASIPNVVHAGLILQMAYGRFDYRPYGLLDDTHLRFFTLKSVLRLFEESRLAILEIDRVVRPVDRTEFAAHEMPPDELRLLEFIRQNNPEWQTYQFIVKAVAVPEGSALQTHGQLDAQDRLKDAELTNSVLARRVATVESQLAWVESRLPYRILSAFKRLLTSKSLA